MKRMLYALCVAGILFAGISGTAQAGEVDWYFGMECAPVGTIYEEPAAIFMGTWSTATYGNDEYTGEDVGGTPPPDPADSQVRFRMIRPGWSDGVGLIDSLPPLTGIGDVRIWTNIAVIPGKGYNNPDFVMLLGTIGGYEMPTTIGGNPVVYTLTMIGIPVGYTGPTVWNIPPKDGSSIQSIIFPTLGKPTIHGDWTLGLGYTFEFKAEVVPEPGSMMALAAGLTGFAGLVLRRRS